MATPPVGGDDTAADAEEQATFDTPPPAPAPRRGTTQNRIKMDPEYAATLKRLCEANLFIEHSCPGIAANNLQKPQCTTEALKWADQLRVLVQRELIAQRDVFNRETILACGLQKEIAPLTAYMDSLLTQRRALSETLRAQVDGVKKDEQRARLLMLSAPSSPSYTTELHEAMDAAHEGITAVRSQLARAAAVLEREEAELSAELADHAVEFESWAHYVQAGTGRCDKAAASFVPSAPFVPRIAQEGAGPDPGAGVSVGEGAGGGRHGALTRGGGADEALKAKVRSVDAQLAVFGGPTLNWDAEDHATFLRVRSQLGMPALTTERFLVHVASALVTRSPEDVRAHAEACARREELLEEKRHAVAAWRAAQQATEAERTARERALEEAQCAREDEERTRAERAARAARRARDAAMQRWRVEKEAEAQRAEELRRAEAAARRRRRDREALEHARLRAEVENSLQQRAAEKALADSVLKELDAKEAAERRRSNREELKRLQNMDKERAQKTLEAKRARAKAREEKDRRAQELRRKGTSATPRGVQRDAGRLLQSTHAQEQRHEAEAVARAAPKSRLMCFGGEKGAPPSRRALPAWRTGM